MGWFRKKAPKVIVKEVVPEPQKVSPAIDNCINKRYKFTKNQAKALWKASRRGARVTLDSGVLEKMLNLLLLYEVKAPFVAEHGFVEALNELIESGDWIELPKPKKTKPIIAGASVDEIKQIESAINKKPIKTDNNCCNSNDRKCKCNDNN